MVNIIISRKGFDSCAGGCASPIMPDGKTIVSLPIPGDDYSKQSYEGLIEQSSGKNYHQIIHELKPTCAVNLNHCHLDPDINPDLHHEKDWTPIFGQEGGAEGILENNSVKEGDIFLFFGWYRGTVDDNGKLRYAVKKDDLDFYHYSNIHMMFGHLTVKEIVRDPEEMMERFPWHPHAERHQLFRNNTMYVGDRKSSGVLSFDEKRVLTKAGRSRSIWDYEKLSWMKEDQSKISMKPVHDENTVRFIGRWQELIIRNAGESCLAWVDDVIKN